jgi:hypothetical protein
MNMRFVLMRAQTFNYKDLKLISHFAVENSNIEYWPVAQRKCCISTQNLLSQSTLPPILLQFLAREIDQLIAVWKLVEDHEGTVILVVQVLGWALLRWGPGRGVSV